MWEIPLSSLVPVKKSINKQQHRYSKEQPPGVFFKKSCFSISLENTSG